jgi:hypothetical protein
MRPSGVPHEVGLGAGFAGAAVATCIVPIASCARPGMHASVRIPDTSNKIPIILFFNVVLLLI